MIYVCKTGWDFEGYEVDAVSTDYKLIKKFAENLAKEDFWYDGAKYIEIGKYQDLKDIK